MSYKHYLLALFFSAFISQLYAQSSGSNPYFLPTVFKKTPNTAAFEKYGNYEVNMYSGVPDISIPLYEVKSGELSLPITLRYHASGIKVSETASWVGLGWSLSAGGEISRNVMGMPDDVGTQGYINGQILNATGNNIDDRTYNGRTFLSRVKDRQLDLEPDIYNYSYPGGGGKFFLNGKNNNKPSLIPYAPVKIDMTGAANSFTITDDKGNSNFFGTTVTSLGTYSFGTVSGSGTSSWPLEKIISQTTKDTISLAYNGVFYNVYAEPTETLVVDDAITKFGACPIMGFTLNPGSSSFSQNGNFVTEQQLNTIYFKNGKAVFKLSGAQRQDITGTNGPKSLQAIEIYRYNFNTKSFEITRTIRFYQSYFVNGTDAGSLRLRLDSIGVADAIGNVEQKHRFSYNPLTLPNRGSNGRDWWGYYNGMDAQSSMIPRTTIDYVSGPTDWTPNGANQITVGGADSREADPKFMQAAMLMRIQYPTGGFTDFNYETNRYVEAGTVRFAGGLRVRSIRSFDGINSTPMVKTYDYNVARKNFDRGNGNTSSTVGSYAFMTTQYLRYLPSPRNGTDFVCGQEFTGTMRRRTFVSSPTVEMEPWDNVPVAYPTVTEYIGNGTVNTGKNVYTFTDYTDAPVTASMVGKPMYTSYFYRRGQLASKSSYANIGSGQYRIVQREQMNYSAFPDTSYQAVGLRVGRFNVNVLPDGYDAALAVANTNLAHQDDGQFQVGFYSIASDDNYMTSKRVTMYDQADTSKFLSTLTQYNYKNMRHQQVSEIVSTDSKGNTRVSSKTYAPDFLPPNGTNTGNTVLDNMISRNILSTPVETYDAQRNTPSAQSQVISGVLTRFKAGVSNAILPDSIFKLGVLSPLVDFQPVKIVSGSIVRDSRYQGVIAFNGYDSKNNIIQYTSQNAGGPTSLIWDYSNDLPIAEIKNGAISASAYTGFEANGNGNWTISGSGRATTGITGQKSYDLANGPVSKSGLSSSASYTVTYWTTNAVPYTISGSQSGYPVKGTNINGWTMFQHLITGVTSVSISGSGKIDELRLYPSGGQMTTYAYDPSGNQTAVSDVKGLATYYEYDPLQRLKHVRDRNGNILQTVNYKYGTSIANNQPPLRFYSFQVSKSYQRTNCAGDLIGGSKEYIVEEGKYSSMDSQAAADQLATDDLNTNGPAYANANGACLVPRYNVLTSRQFTKNNCGDGKTGGNITINVQPQTYVSTVSVEAANQMANEYLDKYGQRDANSQGSCPLGTDIANWTISAYVDQQNDPTYHRLRVTITRPQGDINNHNDVTFRVIVSGKADYIFNKQFMPGEVSNVYDMSFSIPLQGVYQNINLDSIN